MKSILSNPFVLSALASEKTLLAFDFDGTLAPIVADRDAARMAESTARALREVCALYPCAVVSGRTRTDVGGRLGGANVRYIIGNHGLEGGPLLDADLARLHDESAAARDALCAGLAGLAGVEGVEIEDKGHSLAIHFRASLRPEHAHELILEAAAATCPTMRIVEGKCVVNVVPKGAPHKGEAIVYLRNESRSDRVLFVGDDITDEDVFALSVPWLVSVRVGPSDQTRAEYAISAQREIDLLLAELVRLRS